MTRRLGATTALHSAKAAASWWNDEISQKTKKVAKIGAGIILGLGACMFVLGVLPGMIHGQSFSQSLHHIFSGSNKHVNYIP